MQDNRIAAVTAHVQGLGLCDVLRIELEPCQIVGMIEELEERRGQLHEAFQDAGRRWDALDERERERSEELNRTLSESAYALWVCSAIRNQLPAVDHGGAVAVTGPRASRGARGLGTDARRMR